jgi:PAS domain S-box-containing protein
MNNQSTLLIVDDDPVTRMTLDALLDSTIYHKVFAVDGSDALLAVKGLVPDLILLDVMLPEMDGFEVCRHLRSDPLTKEVPIILITSLDDRDSKLEGLTAGADEYLTKPFDQAELHARVKNITQLNRYRRLLEERSKFERLFDLSPDGVLLISASGVVEHANSTMNLLLNADPGCSLVGQSLFNFIHAAEKGLLARSLDEILLGGRDYVRLETLFLRQSGEFFPVDLNAARFFWDGQTRAQVIVRDISEQKKAREELARALEEVTQAYDDTLEGWSLALQLKDRETEEHTRRAVRMTVDLARLVGIPEADLVHVRRGPGCMTLVKWASRTAFCRKTAR